MENLIHYTNCPVCDSQAIALVFAVTDHTVSQRSFSIWECKDCSLRLTQDVPDATSISQYYKSEDYISHSNTGKGLVNRLYKLVRNITLGAKRKLVVRVSGKKNGRLLDVGAGTGAFAKEMSAHGWAALGLEPDPDARQHAKTDFGVDLQESAQLFTLPPASFDVITLWHVLEHVHDLHGYLRQLKLLLKDEGRLFIAVPNYTSADASIYKQDWAAYDVPRHLYHFSPESMRKLFEKHGMKLLYQKPMWFDSIYVSLLSSRDKNGKTNWIAAPLIGLYSNIRAFFNRSRCSSLIYVISK
jgi:2-polyprenyl-3-methyl-5-hydroxy-6-metoxy-1,4-benzoquinol methylase